MPHSRRIAGASPRLQAIVGCVIRQTGAVGTTQEDDDRPIVDAATGDGIALMPRVEGHALTDDMVAEALAED